MTATDKVADAFEAVGDAAEVVAETNQDVADVIRDTPRRGVGLAIGAFLVGAGISGGLTFIFTKRWAEIKYSKLADDEIVVMRQHYQMKAQALESEKAKRPVNEIVRDKGYATPASFDGPPMAVQPPAGVAMDEEEEEPDDSEMGEDAVEGPNGVKPPPEVRNIFRERDAAQDEDVWDWHEERRKRSPDRPYVIHYDERYEMDGYAEMTLTYYTLDDVLCNDRDEIIDPDGERERLVGEANLDKFGHGSQDPSIVFVRNDTIEVMYEIVKSPNSFAEEVHGFQHEAWDRGNLERMRIRERDDPEE